MLINATIAQLHTAINIFKKDTLGVNQRSVFMVYNVINITITGITKFLLPNNNEKAPTNNNIEKYNGKTLLKFVFIINHLKNL